MVRWNVIDCIHVGRFSAICVLFSIFVLSGRDQDVLGMSFNQAQGCSGTCICWRQWRESYSCTLPYILLGDSQRDIFFWPTRSFCRGLTRLYVGIRSP